MLFHIFVEFNKLSHVLGLKGIDGSFNVQD
jgi:hypothetical protein